MSGVQKLRTVDGDTIGVYPITVHPAAVFVETTTSETTLATLDAKEVEALIVMLRAAAREAFDETGG